jgi:hypothetical protein
MEILSIFVSAAGLFWGAVYFCFLGGAAQYSLGVRIGRPDFFHRIAIGQVAFIIYFFIRSSIAFWWYKQTANLVSIHIAEPLAIAVLVTGVRLVRRGHLRSIVPALKSWFTRNNYGLWSVAGIAVVLALRELPRNVPISTDSAQYTFFTKQIALFGVVPHIQFSWGELHFDYPAGFAVLNHAWSSISGINAAGITAIQTVLQAQLTWLMLAEFAFRFLSLPISVYTAKYRLWRIFGLGLLVYYLIFPVGYEQVNYMNLGAGKASSLMLLSFFLVLTEGIPKFAQRYGYWLLMVALFAVLFLINPSLVILPASMLAVMLVWYLIRNDSAVWFSVGGRAIVATPVFLVVFLDPTYYQQFILRKLPHLPPYNNPAAPVSQGVSDLTARLLQYVKGQLASDLLHILPLELIKPELLIIVAFFLLRASKYFTDNPFWQPRFRWLNSQFVSIFVSAIVLTFALRVFLVQNNAVNLLVHYLHRNSAQLVQVLIMLVIVCVLLTAPWGHRLRARTLAIGLIFGLPLSVVMPDRLYDTDLRRLFRNSVTPDDQKIFAQIAVMYSKFADAAKMAPHLSPATPRILILNDVVQINNENWLFPVAAGNVLPLQQQTFPCAFFYFQGSEDYSYENYINRVAKRLDKTWLAARNISWVYVPSEMPEESKPAWVREYAKTSAHVVAQSGRAMLLKL